MTSDATNRPLSANPYIVACLEAIDATRGSHHPEAGAAGSGRTMTGDRPPGLVMIAFPDRRSAERWYASSADAAIRSSPERGSGRAEEEEACVA